MTRVLLTACGCPGAATLIRMLRREGVFVFGVDVNPNAVGRFLCDGFQAVPLAHDAGYLSALLDVVEKQNIDVLLPESSLEIFRLSAAKDQFNSINCAVMVSEPIDIAKSSDKFECYRELDGIVPLPEYYWPHHISWLEEWAERYGYPGKPFVIKPHSGRGSRGFRIIDANMDQRDILLNYKAGDNRYLTLDDLKRILPENLPELLVMEYLKGREYTVDALCLEGEILLASVKSVDKARWGVIVEGETQNKPELIGQARKIAEHFEFDYFVNMQFIGNKLIEINPRVSTFMYQPDLNYPYLGVKLAAGEMSADEVRGFQSRVRTGWRMVRYMDQVFYSDSGEVYQ